MDPLSDILSVLRLHDWVAAGLDAGGDWSVRFKRHAGLKRNDPWWVVWFAAAGIDAQELKRRPRSNLGDQFFESRAVFSGAGAAVLTPDFHRDDRRAGG